MKRPWFDYWLDLFLLVSGVVLGTSSILLWVIFPRGYFPSRVLWVEIHKWSGFTVGIGAILHVGLHAKWLWRMTKRGLLFLR